MRAVNVPGLPEAQIGVVASKVIGGAYASREVYGYLRSSTSGVPPTSLTSVVNFSAQAENSKPGLNESLKAKTGRFSWESVGEQTALLEVKSSAPGMSFAVVTNEKSVELERLYKKVGVPELLVGNYRFELTTGIRQSVDTPMHGLFAGSPRIKSSSAYTSYGFSVIP